MVRKFELLAQVFVRSGQEEGGRLLRIPLSRIPMFARLCLALCATIAASFSAPGIAGPVPAPTEVGLVLSGGGARGFAHIGVLKAMEELRVPVKVVAATSMGAMVGGGFALGYSAEQIEELTLGIDWRRMFSPRPPRQEMTWQGKKDDARFGMAEFGINTDGLQMAPSVFPVQELDIFLHKATGTVSRINDLSQLSIPFAAMATDLVKGEEVVLQKDMQLSLAMRASMSIPGAFAPVAFQGHMLVDGGLVDNLPVAQARKMGAKHVIAVNVGTPLSDRSSLNNVVGVLGQMVNLLTEQNVRRSLALLGQGDVLIVPELDEYTSADFSKAKEIIAVGYKAAMAHAKELRAYSVDAGTYAAWAQARADQVKPQNNHYIERVEVEGLKTVNPERVRAEVDIAPGSAVSDEKVADAARYVWGSGDFLSVPYHFEPGDKDSEVLVFTPLEKTWGYSTLRIGGNIETDFGDNSRFNAIVAHTLNWADAWGAMWRTELQLGENRHASTSWQQPLGPTSNWFLKPHVSYHITPYDLYRGSQAIATYQNRTFSTGLDLGYNLGRSGEFSLGVGWQHESTDAEVSNFGDGPSRSTPFGRASIAYDTMDSYLYPRKGFQAQAWVQRDKNTTSDGYFDNTSYHVSSTLPVALGDKWFGSISARLEESSQLRNLHLGGALNLSGSPYGRYTGDRLYFGRVMVVRSLSESMELIGMPVFAGVSLEAGKTTSRRREAWQENDQGWKLAGGLFAGVDSWLGPIYLVVGRTFGDSTAVTLYWGKQQ